MVSMKIRVPTSFVIAFILIIVLGVFNFIEVPCPFCKGAGILNAAQDLKVDDIEHELIKHEQIDLQCGYKWGEFIYTIRMSLANEEKVPINGYIMIGFFDPSLEKPGVPKYSIFRAPIYVNISADTVMDLEREIVKSGIIDIGAFPSFVGRQRVEVELGGKIICPLCEEEGKLAFTEYIKEISR